MIAWAMTLLPIKADLPIAETGHRQMAAELDIVKALWMELRASAEVTAVHETRKALRRSFTLFDLFTPYYAPEALVPYRKGLRKIMRRLAPCRDAAVFRQKLANFQASQQPLPELALYWERYQEHVDHELRDFLGRASVSRVLEDYDEFLGSDGAAAPHAAAGASDLLVRHVLPALLFELIGAVRAKGDKLPSGSPEQFHELRIQFKELRYTLTFFEKLLGGSESRIMVLSKQMQEQLGDLNDAYVAVDLLDGAHEASEEAGIYQAFQRGEVKRLTAAFLPLYAEFDRPKVRREVALVLARL